MKEGYQNANSASELRIQDFIKQINKKYLIHGKEIELDFTIKLIRENKDNSTIDSILEIPRKNTRQRQKSLVSAFILDMLFPKKINI